MPCFCFLLRKEDEPHRSQGGASWLGQNFTHLRDMEAKGLLEQRGDWMSTTSANLQG